jgi:Core-2/I-Branching enzyme
MRDRLNFILLYFMIWARRGYPVRDVEGLELPADDHLSPYPLPHELLDEDECTCDSHKPSCHVAGKNFSCPEARIFYFVGIHNNRTLEDAVFLIRGIRDPRNTILIHIDQKFAFANYENSILRQEVEACPCGSHVEVKSIYNAAWGKWSMVEPTLWAMEKAVTDYRDKWDVFINLSGDTLPVYKPDRLAKLFGGPLAGINFITSSACATGLRPTAITAFPESWHKRKHYSQHPMSLSYKDDDGTVHSNVSLVIHFGSQWMSLQPDWCEHLVQQMRRPDSLPNQFRDYLVATKKLMTDETFIPTLIMHLRPETTPRVDHNYRLLLPEGSRDIPDIYAIRYERMDEHVPSSNGWYPTEQRYEVPKSSGVDVPKPWGPYYLGVYDLANIRMHGAFFIRKVATAIDPNLFRILPVNSPEEIPRIEWPREVAISPLPDWEKKLATMKEKYVKEKEQKAAAIKVAEQRTLGEHPASSHEIANEIVGDISESVSVSADDTGREEARPGEASDD